MDKQIILDNYQQLSEYFIRQKLQYIFVVCGASFRALPLHRYLESQPLQMTLFCGFHPNPTYESVLDGVQKFQSGHYDLIAGIGGGSAIDTAKCIRLFSNSAVPLLAVPTTAGSGSEATRYAVIYRQGRKQSVTEERCIPDVVLLDPSGLKSLPSYHRKAAMLDALCHGIESFWSVHSTQESMVLSESAIRHILVSKDGYLKNQDTGNAGMLRAAHTAGEAINITQTTAGHALSYGLTSRYGIAHGHAVALCVAELWPYLLEHMNQCIDPRGSEHLSCVLRHLDYITNSCFADILTDLQLNRPILQEGDLKYLMSHVNPERLKNNPVLLDEDAIRTLYCRMLLPVGGKKI